MKDGMNENLKEIQENIARAAEKSGRDATDITLLAVSKTIPIERIRQAYALGIRQFGENRVQELLPKCESFPEPDWHMIGHLQTNKVKFIVEKVKLIHSVDSIRLAEEINKRAARLNITANILIEINIAEEDTKQGVSPQNADFLIEQIQTLSNVHTKGLMCVAPFVEDPEQNRRYFEKMRTLYVDIKGRRRHNMDMTYLSMGMSGDYQVAIEEGANIVRIGTSLFGNRS